ncbi:MAG: DUF4139 domain-containing protein, partial [Rhodospirillales bacterium]|nr:DUF4139 domain-containing protein [Rhodospirillales bacterium]
FEGVSARLMPETASLRTVGPGEPFTVVEQSFDFDVISPRRLLEKSVGKEVTILHRNPTTGADLPQRVRVLAVGEGVVLESAGHVETAPFPERVVYEALPPGLRDRPTLLARLSAPEPGRREAELSYLTAGLSWRADYVAELAGDDSRLDLKGWVTLTNTTGGAFANARLHLVAGTVNRVQDLPPPRPVPMAMKAERAAAVAPAAPQQEAFAGYHLYSLERPVTIADNQTRQLALLGGAGIAVEKDYVVTGETHQYYNRIGDPAPQKAALVIRFENSGKNHLGEPLPQGTMRVYKPDAGGALHFIGEDRLRHTAVDETVKLRLGEDFDVSALRTQKDFQQVAERVWESTYEIKLRNAKDRPVTVTLREPMPGDWQVLQESAPHTRESARLPVWSIAVPAAGQAVLTYRVRVKL